MFETFKPTVADPLLGLIAAFAEDRRPEKVDLGVGMYRDENGRIPVMSAVKSAELRVAEKQPSKSYLGPVGNLVFLDRLADLTFGTARPVTGALASLQTPGGTAALRMAAEIIRAANPDATVWLLDPTWINHRPIFASAGLRVDSIAFIAQPRERPDMGAVADGLKEARPGDGVVLHGCCHNPSGLALTTDEWATLMDILAEGRLLPVVDQAYQGLGDGLDEDASALRQMAGRLPEMLVTVTCSKNFGLYRERTGALFALAGQAGAAGRATDIAARVTRGLYFMPPDHGAAIVAEILADADLARRWRDELDGMRARVLTLRAELAAAHPRLAFLASGRGIFALLPIGAEGVCRLRTGHGIYMAPNARINIAGLRRADIPRVARLLAAEAA